MNPKAERDYQIIDEIKYLESIKIIIDNRIKMLKHRENSLNLQKESQKSYEIISQLQDEIINNELNKVLEDSKE